MRNIAIIKCRQLYEDGKGETPSVKVIAKNGYRRSEPFYAQIDTGSGISMLPAHVLEEIGARQRSDRVNLIYANGETGESIKKFDCGLYIDGIDSQFRLRYGVIAKEEGPAIIGMDVIQQCGLLIINGIGILIAMP